MRIVEPSVELLTDLDGAEIMRFLEKCGRTCYKSEANITDTSADKFIRNIIRRGHESVIEHFGATFKVICDRGVMAELTRHRHASFSVESTRYCDYSKDGLHFIKAIDSPIWENAMIMAERFYLELRANGVPPEIARSVLPNSLATEMIVTANLREWRHVLTLRTSEKAHPQMRQVMRMVLAIFKAKLPVIFEDIGGECIEERTD